MITSKNIPLAIAQLRLCSAFKGYNPPILECVVSNNANDMMVVDGDAKFSSFTRDENKRSLAITIKNVNGEDIYLLSIDNQFIANRTGGIADCAIFNERLFYFVEFKTNAEGKSIKQIVQTYKKALEQLDATYTLFSDRIKSCGIIFQSIVSVKCNIVVNDHFPRISAIEQNFMIEAAQLENHLDLSFESEISF